MDKLHLTRRDFVVGSAAATAVGATAGIAACSHSSLGQGGSFLPGIANHVINVQYATNTIGGYTFRTRTYNGTIPGPILEARPGQTLGITIVNQLPPNPPAPVPNSKTHRVPRYESMEDFMRRRPSGTQIASGNVDPMNNPHKFNTTNLHVHGIQTVPHLYDPIGTSNAASMMIAIEPGTSYTYAFPVPADHPSGLFWFHPHHHGSTDVQVAGGMAGLIVVRGDVDAVPEIAAAREIFMVIQTLEVYQQPDGTYGWEPTAYQAPRPAAPTPPPPNGYNNSTDYAMMTVNGQGVVWMNVNTGANTPLGVPQFSMQPGEIVRLRLLNGTNSWFLPLVLPGMPSYLIGFDGVNLPAPAPVNLNFSGTVTPLNIASGTGFVGTAPGNRIEMLVQAPTTPGTYTLSAAAQSGIAFNSGTLALAQFNISGTSKSMTVPATLPTPTREYPLIADSEIVGRRTIQFHESVSQPPGFPVVLTGFWAWIDGALFDEMHINQTVKVGTAEEWTIVNQTTCGHPFHLHVNSFEVIEVNGKPVPPTIWDTFMVPPAQVMNPSTPPFDGFNPPGSIKIRIRFKQWTGKTVFHCHILTHEDTGMMNNILLT